jgi:hypothetical protein
MRTMDFVFCLSASDIIELRELGVSDDVLEAIIETALVIEEERHERRVERVTYYPRISAGYWSPWYRYPCGWGSYYDPFPTWYSYYYYPFLYDCSFAWYGWAPSTYYYVYHWYDVACDYTPHDSNYRDEAGLTVTTNRPGQLVSQPPNLVPSAGVPPVAAAPVASPRPTAQDTGRDYLRSISRDELDRTPYRSTAVATPPPPRSATQERSSLFEQQRARDLQVRQPRAVTPQPRTTTPRVEPATPPTPTPRSTPPATTPRSTRPATTPTVRSGSTVRPSPPPAVRSRPTSSRRATSVKPPSPSRVRPQSIAPRRSVTPQTKSPTRLLAPARTRTAPQIKRTAPAVRRAPTVKAKAKRPTSR